MKIAVLSGKGGTGKTTISVNLFSYIEQSVLIDTDVEEPNCHIFLQGHQMQTIPINKEYPIVDSDACTLCGACGDACNFNAILPAKRTVLVFEDLCHDCGFCQMVCPSHAIRYETKEIGHIEEFRIHEQQSYYSGTLEVGEVSGVKIIEGLKHETKHHRCLIIDCPPGVSCSTVAAIHDVDYAIIVAEPTPFGVSDMKMVVELLTEEQLPFGVVINKSGIGNNDIYQYLKDSNIPILTEIPFSKEYAKYYSDGNILVNMDTNYRQYIREILTHIRRDAL